MVVIIVEKASESLIGELGRRMVELKKGVFVGNLTSTIRKELWNNCSKNKKLGSLIMVYNTNNEQGYEIMMEGVNKKQVIDIDGVQLILSSKI